MLLIRSKQDFKGYTVAGKDILNDGLRLLEEVLEIRAVVGAH
jgi:hypothetical protein